MVEMLSRIEQSGRQGEIFPGNTHLDEITPGAATNGARDPNIELWEFGGQRRQRKGAGREPKAMVPGGKCFRRESELGGV